ncbi:putative phage DNA replication domain protein [Escherichia coli DEC9A]|nr:putative phage DNA replication domain protein [Escherichia coli DEC9A]
MDEAMASLRLLPSYLRDPLIRHLSFLRKKQEADRQKGKTPGRQNAMRVGPCAKYSNVWSAPITAG